MFKNFIIKVFDSSGTTLLGTLAEVQDIAFTKYINSGVGELNFILGRKFDNFDDGGEINFMNMVKVWVETHRGMELVYT